jgi:FAD/FMN-containing dehydrogenase
MALFATARAASPARSRGRTFRRDDVGYEEARRAAMWNARAPARYPDVIVQANDAADVVAAVKQAKREGLRVGVRAGGHSFACNGVRDSGMLLDVSRVDAVHVDPAAMRATTGPGRSGYELAGMLKRHGLFFPSGHCKGVAVGGYLLQGGYGWHSRALGPACMSVEAVDVVTADGALVHASERENADLLWAARGAGPGFFGVVTRFHLRVYRRPRVIGLAAQTFPIAMLEEVFRWAHDVRHAVPDSVELQLIVTHEARGVRGKGIVVVAPVIAEGWRQALRDVAFMNGSRIRAKAASSVSFAPTGLRLLYRGVMTHYPSQHRYAVDNMWTGAPFDELLPGLERIADTLPPAPSHVLWLNWAPRGPRPDMAYSMEDDVYLGLYGIWKDAADDAKHAPWAVTRMREMAHLASGIQLADENLGERAARFASDANMAKLDRLRAAWDPEGRFHAWMGRP